MKNKNDPASQSPKMLGSIVLNQTKHSQTKTHSTSGLCSAILTSEEATKVKLKTKLATGYISAGCDKYHCVSIVCNNTPEVTKLVLEAYLEGFRQAKRLIKEVGEEEVDLNG